MTIKYALTRAEIVQFFLQTLGKSPKLMVVILICSLWPAFIYLSASGAFQRSFTVSDIAVSLDWMFAAFCFMVAWIFMRGKTGERTLSVTESGISTEIGSLRNPCAGV